ncbi:cupin domain-containing protein [Roseovarius rhodophyticola]|uniref:Cupin domain-containing protein n=1 Tax=Roseovarius rhodophyticola TaxID=3080827 RepID=A0ABZ2TJ30_9RHOB|nr:cupin domain-containing protein [Roseovarius sp. W115]MDV2928014.1 cupin domain-containing protein [Roseovarius sp. W115]
MTADEIISTLNLAPHPEGGFFRETWRAEGSGRASGTAIYFLLRGHDDNRWHKVDSAEIWHFYAGAPLVLSVSDTEAGPARDHVLGADFSKGEQPQLIVPPGYWQMARSTGSYTLVGCTVSPGFEFEHFTLAPEEFDIPR